VAHNVNFDYNFIRQEYERAGASFVRKKLCTVRLSRKIIPGLRSYSLGNLTQSVGITLSDRHRAFGDAAATAELFLLLKEKDENDFIAYSLNRNSREALLPPNLPKDAFDQLPESIGIYYFKDEKGKIIYVGKAKNIKKRIIGHFSGNTSTKQKRLFFENVYHVDFALCGNELIASLMELKEIKSKWPRFNRSAKRFELNYGVFTYTDQSGYLRFFVNESGKHSKPEAVFKTKAEAQHFILDGVRSHHLCLRLAGIVPGKQTCSTEVVNGCPVCHEQELADAYNLRATELLSGFRENSDSFLIAGEGRESGEKSIIVVERGRYLGFGFLGEETAVHSIDEAKDYITSQYDDQDTRMIIDAFIRDRKMRSHQDLVIVD
jgi:DNA polymerase-3 subunit epsilon